MSGAQWLHVAAWDAAVLAPVHHRYRCWNSETERSVRRCIGRVARLTGERYVRGSDADGCQRLIAALMRLRRVHATLT